MPPRLARLLAIVAAVALVAGAFVVRARISGNDDVVSGDSSGKKDAPTGDLRIACDEDLAEVCQELMGTGGVVVSEVIAGDVLADLIAVADGTAPQYDGWLTLDPLPEMADVGRRTEGLRALDPELVAVARSALSVLAATDLDCDPVDWACLARTVGADRNVGVADPETALGLLTVGHATAGLGGGSDVGIDAFLSEAQGPFRAVAETSSDGPTQALLRRMVTQPGSATATVAPKGPATLAADTPQGRRLEVRPLAPDATIAVVGAVYAAGDRGDRVRVLLTDETVGTALEQQGWEPGNERTRGLPDPDVLYAIRQEITR